MDALVAFTERYKDEPMVIGNDLRNEIREDVRHLQFPQWGNGRESTDWKMAATKAANKILEVNPNQLIIIEGLNFANDMSPIKTDPITLDVANRLIYSFHYYSWESMTTYDEGYDAFKAGLDANATFMMEWGKAYTTPVWLGEFGTNTSDAYWQYLIKYLGENSGIHWAYWSWNGYKSDPSEDETFGILKADMLTVRHDWKLADLQSIFELGYEFKTSFLQ
jgi:endoglucanase